MKRLLSALFTVFVLAAPALAAEPFSQAGFTKAQDMGSNILVHVHAPWCPTCRAQEPAVAAVEKENPGLMVFRVDFDSQKDAVRSLNVSGQSTLIAFTGKTETGRSVGVTDAAKIRSLALAGGMMKKSSAATDRPIVLAEMKSDGMMKSDTMKDGDMAKPMAPDAMKKDDMKKDDMKKDDMKKDDMGKDDMKKDGGMSGDMKPHDKKM